METLLAVFPKAIRDGIDGLSAMDKRDLTEIRIRVNRPVTMRIGSGEYFIKGLDKSMEEEGAITASVEDCQRMMANICEHSVYLKEEQIRQGYVTVPGGYRVGISGSVCMENGKVKSMDNVYGFTVRIAKEIIGCGGEIARSIVDCRGVKSTLLVSRPRGGKTTILRDLARILSDEHKLSVCIVDERREIAGCVDGVPSFQVGLRTDVLDGCDKAVGMMMAVRTMAPDVLIVDEIGGQEDMEAIAHSLNCGVSVLATAHGDSLEHVFSRGITDVFDHYVLLDKQVTVR